VLFREVKRALAHLYDPVYLRRSALARMLRSDSQLTSAQKVTFLRQMLIEAIEQLAPGENVPLRSPKRRSYLALRARYMEQRPIGEIARDLGISERQLRRELRAGLEAVTGIVSDTLREHCGESDGILEGVMQEIESLDTTEELVNLSVEVRNVQSLVSSLAQEKGVEIQDGMVPESAIVRANRILLRQALLTLYTWVIQSFPESVLRVHLDGSRANVLTLQLSCSSEFPLPRIASPIPTELLKVLYADFEIQDVSGGKIFQLTFPCVPLRPVLLVDDNPSLHRLFKRYLMGLPYRLISAYDAKSGLKFAQMYRPDVIIMDIMMPHQDGWELWALLREDENTEDIPVVICSVLEQEALARSLAAAGYIKKPVTQASLLAVFRSLGLANF